MFSLMSVRRYDLQIEVGLDSRGLVIQLKSYLNRSEPTSSFRPNQYSASLLVASIKKALEGGSEYLPFEFSDENVRLHGQFQEVENDRLGTFKRALFVFENIPLRRNSAGTAYIIVMRDAELEKLMKILCQTYDLNV